MLPQESRDHRGRDIRKVDWPVVAGAMRTRGEETSLRISFLTDLSEHADRAGIMRASGNHGIRRDADIVDKTDIVGKGVCATHLDCAEDLVQCVEANGRFRTVNRAWLATLGYSAGEIRSMHVWDVAHARERDRIRDAYWRFWNGENPGVIETIFVTKSGREIPVEGRLNRQTATGPDMASLDIFRDISDRKQVERLKDEALFVAAHELRTPMTAVALALDLITSMGTEGWDGELREVLDVAVSNVERLTAMVNGLLDFRRISVEGAAISIEDCRADVAVRDAAACLFAVARKAGVVLAAYGTTEKVRADRIALGRILTNLISNAIKFSPKNECVEVSACEDGAEVIFRVADRGRGIPDEFRGRIFGVFQQAHATDASVKGGSGLGLSITKKLVEQHGGRIWFESEHGRGTEFYFSLPRSTGEIEVDDLRVLAEAI